MVEIVTLPEAKLRLRIDADDEDTLIETMLAEATDILIDYLKKPDHGWTADTAPPRIKAAIILIFAGLYEGREPGDALLTDTVRSLVHRDRDPALA